MRGKFLNQKCIFNFFPQAYLLVLSERIVLHPKTFTLDIRQGYLSTITISCFPLSQFSNWIILYQQLYPNSAIGPQFLAASKHALKTLLRLGEKIVNYIYYIKNDHEKKNKKNLKISLFFGQLLFEP